MIDWIRLFKTYERLDASKDSWAEYNDANLQQFMMSDFMQEFANDCSEILKNSGREDYEDYFAVKLQMSSVLRDFDYLSLDAMEDVYSAEYQLEKLQEFREEYLNSK